MTDHQIVLKNRSSIHDYTHKVRDCMKGAGFSKARADSMLVNRIGVVIEFWSEMKPAQSCADYFAQFLKIAA